MRTCIRCDEPLAMGATSCRCGWRERTKTEPERYLPKKCSVSICYVNAMPGHHLCEHHYIQPAQQAGVAKCQELGLHTTDQMRAWLKSHAKDAFKRFPEPVMREPGQDDEWREPA